MRILVTAGPTREFFDDVRFISNPSSGRMGFAVADAARRAGHDVTLIAGPVSLPTPRGVSRIDVVSARDMRRETRARHPRCDCLVMAAAVCDYRPAARMRGKMKKSAPRLAAQMIRNPDILAELGRRKRGRIHVGFALESPADAREAMRKLVRKNLDAIVLNSPEAFEASASTVFIISTDGRCEIIWRADKRRIARRLVALVESLADASAGRKARK